MCNKWLKSSNFNCGELRIQLRVSYHTFSSELSLYLYAKCCLGCWNENLQGTKCLLLSNMVFSTSFDRELLSSGAWKARKLSVTKKSVRENIISFHPVKENSQLVVAYVSILTVCGHCTDPQLKFGHLSFSFGGLTEVLQCGSTKMKAPFWGLIYRN